MPDPGADPDIAMELAELTTRIARTIRRAGSAELAPLGLTFGQARLLRLLATSGPVRMTELAARMDVVPRSATDMVDGLVASGLVERGRDRDDRRSVLVALTGRGMSRIRRMGAARRALATEVFGRLDSEQRAELVTLLRTVAGTEDDAHAGCGTAERGEKR